MSASLGALVSASSSSAPPLLAAIIILWFTAFAIRETGKAKRFSPFFVFGLILIFQSAFILYNLFSQFVWMFLEVAFLLNLLWLIYEIYVHEGFV